MPHSRATGKKVRLESPSTRATTIVLVGAIKSAYEEVIANGSSRMVLDGVADPAVRGRATFRLRYRYWWARKATYRVLAALVQCNRSPADAPVRATDRKPAGRMDLNGNVMKRGKDIKFAAEEERAREWIDFEAARR